MIKDRQRELLAYILSSPFQDSIPEYKGQVDGLESTGEANTVKISTHEERKLIFMVSKSQCISASDISVQDHLLKCKKQR